MDRHAAKDLHALEEVFNQVARLFTVDLIGNDDLHALDLSALNNLARIVCLVSQKCLGPLTLKQLGHRFAVVPLLARGQHKAQWVA